MSTFEDEMRLSELESGAGIDAQYARDSAETLAEVQKEIAEKGSSALLDSDFTLSDLETSAEIDAQYARDSAEALADLAKAERRGSGLREVEEGGRSMSEIGRLIDEAISKEQRATNHQNWGDKKFAEVLHKECQQKKDEALALVAELESLAALGAAVRGMEKGCSLKHTPYIFEDIWVFRQGDVTRQAALPEEALGIEEKRTTMVFVKDRIAQSDQGYAMARLIDDAMRKARLALVAHRDGDETAAARTHQEALSKRDEAVTLFETIRLGRLEEVATIFEKDDFALGHRVRMFEPGSALVRGHDKRWLFFREDTRHTGGITSHVPEEALPIEGKGTVEETLVSSATINLNAEELAALMNDPVLGERMREMIATGSNGSNLGIGFAKAVFEWAEARGIEEKEAASDDDE